MTEPEVDPSPFALIREFLGSMVPFATHASVTVIDVADGYGVATLADETFTKNHVATQHAGALFTVAETASGAAMAGAMAQVVLEARSVVSEASISFVRPAAGMVTATARLATAPSDVRREYSERGRTEFSVNVELIDSTDSVVASMTARWAVSAPRR
jgi:acyl-coenzyme A thioesterase PaaI-like protein